MASTKQKTTRPGQAPRGSVKIPGGYAQFWGNSELSVRRQRELSVSSMQIMPRVRDLRIATARTVSVDGVVVEESDILDGIPAGLTGEEVRKLAELTDVAIWVYLKSWTLKENGQPRPVPTSVDDVLDLEPALYRALADHTAKLFVESDNSGFDVDSLPDVDSDEEVDDNLPT